MLTVSPVDLAAWLADAARESPVLLDVREAWEFELCHIEGARWIPMGEIPARACEMDLSQEIVVICHHGVRSAQVVCFLENQGFEHVINLAGGMAGWAAQVDPSMAQY